MDNKPSSTLEEAFDKYKVKWQYVNLADRAIQIFNNHFKAGLATCDPKFPLDQWDLLLEQAEMTLNMLRSTRINNKLSAYAYLHGEFDFNATQLALPGTKVVVHKKKGQQKTWELNGESAWYTGSAMQHYRNLSYYYLRTKMVKASNTMVFLPHDFKFPEVNLKDF